MISGHFAPDLSGLLARYARLKFEFLVANRLVDRIAENVDVSKRTGKTARFFYDRVQEG
jgi:hypothetical protein